MADAITTQESSMSSQQRPESQRSGRGRSGRGRGGFGASQIASDGLSRWQETSGEVRSRGATRAATSGRGKSNSNTMNASDLHIRFSPRPAFASQSEQIPQVADQRAGDGPEVETEVCFICASPVVHNSVAPCNHRTCHICALRMRALYKTKDCAHCRAEAQYVIFTDDPTKRYEDFTPVDIVSIDENIGIKYERADIVEDTLLLLRYNCPDPSCDIACLGWPDLHRHVRSVHHKKMCDLCTRNKKSFTHEHDLYTDKDLERHMKKGDDNPGAVDQSGFRGHPLCGFCGERFYGDDELYIHCRSKHERCFICDRTSSTRPQYYVNYDSLELHYRKDHFLCPERVCLDKKFIVFASEIDLKHHQLEEHSNTLSKDARRDARVVDMSSFDYRAPYVQERRGATTQREGRGRGRGRDPNTEPLPFSSAQPLRRDEQAFQRQMAIQSAQSVSTGTLGGQLTPAPTPAGRAPPGTQDPTSMTINRPSSNVGNLASQLNRMELQAGDGIGVPPQEQARRLRHSAVIERAAMLLQNDEIKLTRFRNAISSFRTNAISAPALIDTFFALFSDTSSSALGSLIRDVADLYEDKIKSQSLRTAWNDWRAINEDYPSLPGPSGLSDTSLPLGWAQITASVPSSAPTTAPKSTSRVLKLKSSTAQSSRSSASRNASWGSASAPSSNGFPGLPKPSASTAGMSTSSSNSTTAASIVRSTPPISSRYTSRGPIRALGAASGSDAFPALPPVVKPTSTIFGYGSGAIRRDGGGSGSTSSSFAWGAPSSGGGGGSGTQSEAQSESEREQMSGAAGPAAGGGSAAGGNGKKKGNRGKKEVLVKWG